MRLLTTADTELSRGVGMGAFVSQLFGSAWAPTAGRGTPAARAEGPPGPDASRQAPRARRSTAKAAGNRQAEAEVERRRSTRPRDLCCIWRSPVGYIGWWATTG